MTLKRFKSTINAFSVFFAILNILQVVFADHDGSDDPLDWLRDSIPGEPGVDYPIFSEVETTSFSCKDRVFGGYYADPEMQCQGYHVCLSSQFMPGIADRKMSFLCPNGTIFSQALFTCDWWFNVDCSEAESLWTENEIIGDENARIGGGSAPSSQGQRQQPVQQRGRSNNNPQKQQSNRNQGGQKPKPASRRKQIPSQKPQQRKQTSRKQLKTKTRPRQQSNRQSNRKQTSKAKSNGRKKQPSSRKINKNKGSKKRPQKTDQSVTKAPRKPAKVIPSLPDYDGDSDGIPDYKRTKGVGSSSVLGVDGSDRNQDKDIASTTDRSDILVHAENVTTTNIINVEGFDVPTTSNKDKVLQMVTDKDTAIPERVKSEEDEKKSKHDKKITSVFTNKINNNQSMFSIDDYPNNKDSKAHNKTPIDL